MPYDPYDEPIQKQAEATAAAEAALVPLPTGMAARDVSEALRDTPAGSDRPLLAQLAQLVDDAPPSHVVLPMSLLGAMRQYVIAYQKGPVRDALLSAFDQARPAPPGNPRLHAALAEAMRAALSHPGQAGLAARDELLAQLGNFAALYRTATHPGDAEQQRLERGGAQAAAEATYPELDRALREAIREALAHNGRTGLLARDELVVRVRLFLAEHQHGSDALAKYDALREQLTTALGHAMARRHRIDMAARDALLAHVREFLASHEDDVAPGDTDQQRIQEESTAAPVTHPRLHRVLGGALHKALGQEGRRGILAREHLFADLRGLAGHVRTTDRGDEDRRHRPFGTSWQPRPAYCRQPHAACRLLVREALTRPEPESGMEREAMATQLQDFTREHARATNPRDAEQRYVQGAPRPPETSGDAEALSSALHVTLRMAITRKGRRGLAAREELFKCLRAFLDGEERAPYGGGWRPDQDEARAEIAPLLARLHAMPRNEALDHTVRRFLEEHKSATNPLDPEQERLMRRRAEAIAAGLPQKKTRGGRSW